MVLCVHMYMYCVCKFLPTQHVCRWATLLKCEHTCVPPQGLACCFGICAITHLEDTLAQLEDFVRSDVFRKSIGIFNIFKVRRDYPEWRPVAALLVSVCGRMGSCSSDCSSLFLKLKAWAEHPQAQSDNKTPYCVAILQPVSLLCAWAPCSAEDLPEANLAGDSGMPPSGVKRGILSGKVPY